MLWILGLVLFAASNEAGNIPRRLQCDTRTLEYVLVAHGPSLAFFMIII